VRAGFDFGKEILVDLGAYYVCWFARVGLVSSPSFEFDLDLWLLILSCTVWTQVYIRG
jgi:hypothetical protein